MRGPWFGGKWQIRLRTLVASGGSVRSRQASSASGRL